MEPEPRRSPGKPVYTTEEIKAEIDKLQSVFPNAGIRITRLPTGEYRVELDLSNERVQPRPPNP